jgi:predicted phosphodiesterase
VRYLFAGDFHSDFRHAAIVFEYASLNNVDKIIQVGDYGAFWGVYEEGKPCPFSARISKLVDQHNIPFEFYAGNHEMFSSLHAWLPAGDVLKELAPGVTYLPRGHTFEEDGVKFLVCGGGTSIDRKHRTDGVDWFSDERITDEDVELCASKGNDFDVLLTHDFPWEGTILPIQLDSFWGEWAQAAVIESRHQISTILRNSGARIQIHGHLHCQYQEDIWVMNATELDRHVNLVGLGCNGAGANKSTYIFDTIEFNKQKEAT